jgi:citronellol/citronellal dehydrogenase
LTDSKQRFGLSYDELATRNTVYREDLLNDHSVLITGAGSGMGKAMAFLFARLGAKVTICGRKEEKLIKVYDEILERCGKKIFWEVSNVRDPDKVEEMLDGMINRDGKIDTVINNAGGQFPQDAIDFSRKGWLAVVDLNLNGPWWVMQEAAKRWKKSGTHGNIINLVANVERGMPQAAHTCIAPGTIETEGFEVYPDKALERFHKANPMQKLGDVWDIAEAAVYLASDTGSFITGEVLTIDGGMSQWGVVWPAGMPDYFKMDGGD